MSRTGVALGLEHIRAPGIARGPSGGSLCGLPLSAVGYLRKLPKCRWCQILARHGKPANWRDPRGRGFKELYG